VRAGACLTIESIRGAYNGHAPGRPGAGSVCLSVPTPMMKAWRSRWSTWRNRHRPRRRTYPRIGYRVVRHRDGEQVALIGSSGSGKTRCCMRWPGSWRAGFRLDLLRPRRSTTELACSRIPRDRFRGATSLHFQSHHLLPSMSALENVLLGMSFSGRAADRGWPEHLLVAVGLATASTIARTSCRSASSSAWRALARWPTGPRSCSPTSDRSLDPTNGAPGHGTHPALDRRGGSGAVVVSHDAGIVAGFRAWFRSPRINRAAVE